MAHSESVEFTVIIPTRERCHTLRAAIASCCAQDYARFTILVSDNASQDETRKVVESFDDPRIRYINTGARLSMSRNWEFALSHVEAGYVFIMGDDDGLMPDALERAERIIREAKTPLVSWGVAAEYFWPNYQREEYRDVLYFPMSSLVAWRPTRPLVEAVLNCQTTYTVLPMIYNSFVDMALVRSIREQSGGVFFNSSIPDVYSGFCFAAALDRFAFSARPLSLAGVSSKSGGASFFNADPNAQQAANTFFQENDIPFHPRVTAAPAFPICTSEAFLRARDAFAPVRQYDVDFSLMLRAAMAEGARQPEPLFAKVRDAVEEIGRRNGLEDLAGRLIQQVPNRPVIDRPPPFGHNPGRQMMTLNCRDFGVADVAAAAQLVRTVYALFDRGYVGPAAPKAT